MFACENDALFDRLLDLIREAPGVSRSALHKKVGWKMTAATLLGTLSRIQAMGLARSESVKTGGRPTEKWFPPDAEGKEEKEEKVRRPHRRAAEGAFPTFHPSHPAFPPAGTVPTGGDSDQPLTPGSYRI